MNEAPEYLIVKRGLYYRPNMSGYTGIKDNAGRYELKTAVRHARNADGVLVYHQDHCPPYTSACFDDLVQDHLNRRLSAIIDLDSSYSEIKGMLRELLRDANAKKSERVFTGDPETTLPQPTMEKYMTTYNIETSYQKCRNTRNASADWVATLDCYDGAPDTSGIFTAQGHGKTELSAIQDLMEVLEMYDDGSFTINLMAIGQTGDLPPMDYWQETWAEIKRRKEEAAECYAEDHT